MKVDEISMTNPFADWIVPHLKNVKRVSNGQILCTCPWHDDRHPSLSINLGSSQFKCFACDKTGNYEDLCAVLGEEPNQTIREFLYGGDNGVKTVKDKQQRSIPEHVVEEYVRDLSPNMREILKMDRGLSDEVIDRFQLGFDKLTDRITIPVRNEEGCVVNIRKWNGKKVPKILSYKKGYGEARLFPFDVLKDATEVIIVEGELDTLKLISEDITTVTGTCGAETWKPEWNAQFNGKRVVVAYDNDAAGIRGGEKVAKSLAESGVDVRIIVWNGTLPKGEDVTDFFVRNHKTREEFHTLMEAAKPMEVKESHDSASVIGKTQDHLSRPNSTKSSKKAMSQADLLVEIALQSKTELFHDDTNEPFARLFVNEHWETWKIRTKEFKGWIAKTYWEQWGKTANSNALNSALKVIEAKAVFDGQQHILHNRVALYDNAIWYDLADERMRSVRITSDGWEIIDDTPILFKRYAHQQEQVEPIRGGDLNKLLDFVNLTDEPQGMLLLVYIVTCLRPDIPHPIPILHGREGSAKTTLFRILKKLLDPSKLEVLTFPWDINELVQKLDHHWAAFFDNVTKLSPWISDTLCRAVTGEGFSKRMLYTDDDDIIYQFKRCVGLNGINIAATQSDLLDRSIIFELPKIPKGSRKSEGELLAEFEEARPAIMGAMFDALSKAMKTISGVKLDELPRMADFTLWGYAIAEALGFKGEEFLTAYNANIAGRNEEVLQNNPVAQAVIALMKDKELWKGTPSELYNVLDDIAENLKINTTKAWPKASNALIRKLNEVKTNLEEGGITVERDKSKSARIVVLRKCTENTVNTVKPAHEESDKVIDDDGIDDKIVTGNLNNGNSSDGNDDIDGISRSLLDDDSRPEEDLDDIPF